MTEDKNAEFPVSEIRVCIEQTEPGYRGIICGITLEKDIPFTSKTGLIWAIEEAYKKIGRPQPRFVPRSFIEGKGYDSYIGNPVKYHTSREIHERHGAEATYDMIMVSWKNAEWQGMWKNTDGTIRSRFETMLECIGQV